MNMKPHKILSLLEGASPKCSYQSLLRCNLPAEPQPLLNPDLKHEAALDPVAAQSLFHIQRQTQCRYADYEHEAS
jgi:hypothetical protein